ncbi:MAG: hypothetical protein IPN62_00300 [Flavobacteriales bacterium]|nr:hypothetical protein [Flavobacteriales bacterium]
MRKPIITLLSILALAMASYAQTTAVFIVSQPPQFLVDAGADQIYIGAPLTLGGFPTATGGGGTHTYVWEPSALLNNPTSPNPVVSGLTATTLFTVTATDVTSGCMKSNEVEVIYDILAGMNEFNAQWGRIYPNPAATLAWVEARAGRGVAAYPSSRWPRLGQCRGVLLTVSLASGQLINHKLCKASSAR